MINNIMTSEQSFDHGRVIMGEPNTNSPVGYIPNSSILSGGYWSPNTTCPPGLEYLIHLDKIFLHQRIEPFEVAIGIHACNRYTVVDVRGQPLYVIREQSGWLMRTCIGRNRRFKMSIYDIQGREALLMKRPLRIIGDTMNVYSSNTLLGTIEKTVISCRPEYRISVENGAERHRIRGPLCICGWNIEFSVLGNNGNEIGMIRKQWSGAIRELFTNADIFGVTFPANLNVKDKALLLAASLLIDFGYFEQH